MKHFASYGLLGCDFLSSNSYLRTCLRMVRRGARMRVMYYEYLTVVIILFLLSLLGIILNRTNLIIMIMCIELMLLAVSFMLLLNSVTLDSLNGQMFTMIVLAVAASESAVGLAIMVAFYRIKGNINIRTINLLKG